MEFLVYIIPLLVAIPCAIFFQKRVVWWEYVLIIFGSALFSLAISAIMRGANMEDVEYWGDYVSKVRYYEPWDEWIEQRCTREVQVGTDKDGEPIYETETYDCSYREYHMETWSYFDSHSHEHPWLGKEPFNYIKARFGVPSVFVDMHRDYYTIDGDAHDYIWPKTTGTIQTLTTKHAYVNKIKNSHSIFKYEDITKKTAKDLSLFEYPQIKDVWSLDQNPILVGKNTFSPTKNEIDSVKFINGYYGEKRQFRMFVLLFPENAEFELSEYQKSYWQGGNKNELIVCISATHARKVNWVNTFSWEDAPLMAVKTRDWVTEHGDSLSISNMAKFVESNLSDWKRKEFADFKYIHVELKRWQEILLIILSLLAALGIGFYVVANDFENEN